ncbi:MAG TPA: hypothetical protein VI452_04865, partial [Marmoricola sp.]
MEQVTSSVGLGWPDGSNGPTDATGRVDGDTSTAERASAEFSTGLGWGAERGAPQVPAGFPQ